MEIEIVRLNLDLNLPKHDNELSVADKMILKLKDKVKSLIDNNSITSKIHSELYEEIIKILDYVGNLSMSIFNLEEEIENSYVKAYIKNPIKVKLFWYEHYSELHKPYSLKKNRCFTMLDELDEIYFKKFKNFPANYNY